MALQVGSLLARLGLDSGDFDRDTDRSEKKFGKLGKSFGEVGKNMTKYITLPLVAAGVGVLKLGANFEKSYNKIRVGTGATGKDLKNLQKDFKAVYSTVPAGMDDVSTAIADINTRTGLTGKGLQSLSTQMLNLSRVTGEDLNSIIESSSRLFGDWSIAQEDTGDTMDYLFKVSQSTGISVNDLNSKLVQFGAPLRQMGFDLEKSAAMLGKWEKEGVNAELVLGGLRVALGKMAREGVTDTSAALTEVIGRIKEAGSTGEANAIALELFGARVGPDMAAAIREGRFELADLISSLKESKETINGVSKETLTFSERLEVFKNKAAVAFEPLAIQLIASLEKLTPSLVKLFENFTKLTTWFAGLKPSTQKVIIGFIAIVAAIGPLLTVISKVILAIGWLQSAWAVIAPFFTGVLIPAITGLAVALGIPVWAVAALVAAVIAGIVLIIMNWEKVKSVTIAVWEAIATFFTEKVPEIFWGIIEWFRQLPDTISNFFVELKDRVVASVIEFAEAVIQKHRELSIMLVQIVIDMIQAVIWWFQTLPERIVYIIGFLLGTVIRLMTQLGNGIISAVTWMVTDGVDLFISFVLGVIEWVSKLPGRVLEFIGRTATNIHNGLVKAKIWAIETAIELFNGVVNWISKLPERILSILKRLLVFVGNTFNEIRNKVIEIAGNILSGFSDIINDLPGIMKNVFDKVWAYLKTLPGKMWDKAKSIAGSFWNGFKEGLGIHSPSFVEKAFMNMGDRAMSTIKDLKAMSPHMRNAVKGMTPAFMSDLNQVPMVSGLHNRKNDILSQK
jgi:phage-related minor tail protein